MFKKVNWPLTAFFIFVVRLVAYGAGLGDAFALIGLCGLVGLQHWVESKKEAPVNDQIKHDVSQLKDAVNALKVARTFGK